MKSLILYWNKKFKNDPNVIWDHFNDCHENLLKIKYKNASLFGNYKNINSQKDEIINSFKKNQNNYLSGICYSLKDNISTKDIPTTGGSKFLEKYIPSFDATIYKKLKEQNGILMSKSNLDEFGLGALGTFSSFGIVKNALNDNFISGGSSSGSVVEVASNACVYALATDTGDSIRRPASFNGVVGFKPSYGLISRYGVYPYAPSLDHVGIIAKYVTDVSLVLDQIAFFDQKDFTSQKWSQYQFTSNLKISQKPTFVVIDNLVNYLSDIVLDDYLNFLKKLEQKYLVKHITLPIELLKTLQPTYLTISYAEASSCYANMTGIPFGTNHGGKNYKEILFNNRTQNFGDELKRRFIIGAYITKAENFEKIYQRSKKMRTYIIEQFNRIFDHADCLILPSASSIASTFDTCKKHQTSNYVDDCLLFANFAGSPSITLPLSHPNKMAFGINLNCKQNCDHKLLAIANLIEDEIALMFPKEINYE